MDQPAWWWMQLASNRSQPGKFPSGAKKRENHRSDPTRALRYADSIRDFNGLNAGSRRRRNGNFLEEDGNLACIVGNFIERNEGFPRRKELSLAFTRSRESSQLGRLIM
jgi:hypothetical protein